MKLPQLSLRDLFWLVLVMGMGCGWLVHAGRLAAQLSELDSSLARSEERLFLAEDDKGEWRDRYHAMLDAIEAEGYTAYWQHHSRTVELERHKP